VLIAVPETAWSTGRVVVGAAVPTATALRAFLERRFPGAAIELVAPAPGRPVTKAAVLAAFEAARPAPGELFVVLFFGHGIPADAEHPYQSWALTAEELTDVELARQLQSLPAGVDTVVISNCCYGRGFLHAGPRSFDLGGAGADGAAAEAAEVVAAPSPAELQQLSRAFAIGLQEAVDSPMVCISAAGNGVDTEGGVLNAVAAQLVNEVMAAAERGMSYGALDAKFRTRRHAGREFYVDARPPEHLHRIVLGTEIGIVTNTAFDSAQS
jgi:hypothetical protein